MPLVVHRGPMLLRASDTASVLGRTGRGDDGGIQHDVGMQREAVEQDISERCVAQVAPPLQEYMRSLQGTPIRYSGLITPIIRTQDTTRFMSARNFSRRVRTFFDVLSTLPELRRIMSVTFGI